MQLRANQLSRHLAAGEFRDIYLVSGDEQLLVDEACDAIIEATRAHGFDERTVFEAAPRAAWDELFRGAANLSLFATKRLLDIRIPARGLDRAGSDALRRYLDAPLADTLLLCRAIGLEWRQRSSAWHKAIDKAGAVIPIFPVSARDLPRWLERPLPGRGLEPRPRRHRRARRTGGRQSPGGEAGDRKAEAPRRHRHAGNGGRDRGGRRLLALRHLRDDRRRTRRPRRPGPQDASQPATPRAWRCS